MQDKKNNLDKFFQKSFDDFEVEPSNRTWNNIDRELTDIAITHRKKKKLYFRLIVTSFSLLLLLVSFGIITIENPFLITKTGSSKTELAKPIENTSTKTSGEKETRKNTTSIKRNTLLAKNSGSLIYNTSGKFNIKKTTELKSTAYNKGLTKNKHNNVFNKTAFASKQSRNTELKQTKNSTELISPNTNTLVELIAPVPVIKNREQVIGNDAVIADTATPLAKNNNGNEIKLKEDSIPVLTDNLKQNQIDTTESGILNTQNAEINGAKKTTMANKWLLSLAVAPQYSSRYSTTIQEKSKLGYSIAGNVGYEINKNLSVNMGVGYAVKNFENNTIQLQHDTLIFDTYQDQIITTKTINTIEITTTTTTIFTIPDSVYKTYITTTTIEKSTIKIDTTKITNNIYQYNTSQTVYNQTIKHIEIPVFIMYSKTLNRFKVYLSTGIAANIIVGSKTTYTKLLNSYVLAVDSVTKQKTKTHINEENTSYEINTTENYSQLNFSVLAGLGAQYKLTQKMYVTVEPNIRYTFSNVTKNRFIKTMPYSLAVSFGILWKM